jgi:hypothetical protein
VKRYCQTAARKLGWNRGPLRRRVDRAETAAMSMLLAALVIVGPLLAIFASHATAAAALREQHAERGWYQVTAVLTQSAGQAVLAPGQVDVAWVRARWTERGDRQRTGVVAAPLNSPAGERVPIWLTQSGQQTHAPLSAADVHMWVLYAVGLAISGWFVVLLLAAILIHVLADRRRMAGWQREWAAFASRRSHQG